jgi:outer membrane lipoprotein SlyB
MDTTLQKYSSPTALKPQKSFAAAFAVLALALAGCASGLGANTYERAQVGTVSRVEEGTVVASRTIMIEGSKEGKTVGTLTGAALGGIAGGQIGQGRAANTAGAIVGAVAGGALGNAIGASATQKPGFAYTVRLRSGELVTITQGGDMALANGTPVLVEYGERARVIPQNASIGY